MTEVLSKEKTLTFGVNEVVFSELKPCVTSKVQHNLLIVPLEAIQLWLRLILPLVLQKKIEAKTMARNLKCLSAAANNFAPSILNSH